MANRGSLVLLNDALLICSWSGHGRAKSETIYEAFRNAEGCQQHVQLHLAEG